MKPKITLIPIILASSMLLTGCPASTTESVTKVENGAERVSVMSAPDTMEMGASARQVTDDRKLVRKVDLALQIGTSNELQTLMFSISNEATNAEGYVSYQSIDSGWSASGNMTVHIPKDKTDTFLSCVKENESVRVTRYNDSVDDITTRYVDVESRLNSSNAAKERYMAMLEDAETVTEVLEIQSKLDTIIAEEESYKSQMMVMDKEIDYTEVDISIDCMVNEDETPVLQKLKESLSELGTDAVDAILSGLNWCVMALIWLLFASPVIVLFILVVRFALRFSKKRFRKPEQDKNTKEE